MLWKRTINPAKKKWRKESRALSLTSDQLDEKWRSVYARQAPRYDSVRASNWKKQQEKHRTAALVCRLVPRDKNITVLDVATGTGIVGLAVASQVKYLVGVDLTEAMLQEAQRKMRQASISNFYLSVANARQLPFRDSEFDVVVSRRFLHLIPNRLRSPIIKEMVRVTKPGGVIILEFANPFFGIFAELYRRWILGKNSIYLWPWQTKSLLKGLKIVQKKGTYLPLNSTAMSIHPGLSALMYCLCEWPGICHLASELYYVCINPK